MEPYFSHIIGNERVKKRLLISLQKKAWNQPFCFQGIDGIGKSLFAKAFAKAILETNMETHPDIIELHPVGKLGLHAVDAVRSFCEEAYTAPYSAKHKVMIIHEADRMLSSSANALLKTLEEPGEGVVIILLTNSYEDLLLTIKSRVRTIYFEPIASEAIAEYLTQKNGSCDALSISCHANGSLKRALMLACGIKEPAMDLIELLVSKKLNYIELKRFLNEMESTGTKRRNALDEEASLRALAPFKEMDLNAKQKGEIEKLVQGHTSVEAMQEAKNFFLSILTFFRDLHVIYNGGHGSFLVHKHLASKMFDIATAKEPIALEKVEEATKEALTALERSLPLSSCIENLFLKLNLV